jgi:hypothetical protein
MMKSGQVSKSNRLLIRRRKFLDNLFFFFRNIVVRAPKAESVVQGQRENNWNLNNLQFP